MEYTLRILFFVILFAPLSVNAQENDLLSLIAGLGGFINNSVIPFLLAVGFIAFAVNVVRYFIIDSTDDQGRKNARALALYGVTAFVIILIFWGVINLFTSALGLRDRNDCIPVSEYFFGEGCMGEPTVSEPDYPPTLPQPPEPEDPPTSPGPIEPSPTTEPGDPPTTPSPPVLPEPDSFDQTLWEEVLSTEDGLRAAMNNYADNLDELYGLSSTALVEAGLFADFTETARTDGFNALDRLQAAYRLRELGEISGAEFTAYYDAVNNYREDMIGAEGAIPMSEVAAISIPVDEWPANVRSHNLIVAGGIEAELEAYNERIGTWGEPLSESEIEYLVTSTTDITLPYEDRIDLFDSLIGYNPDRTVYIEDDDGALYDLFIQGQNTERLLNNEGLSEIF